MSVMYCSHLPWPMRCVTGSPVKKMDIQLKPQFGAFLHCRGVKFTSQACWHPRAKRGLKGKGTRDHMKRWAIPPHPTPSRNIWIEKDHSSGKYVECWGWDVWGERDGYHSLTPDGILSSSWCWQSRWGRRNDLHRLMWGAMNVKNRWKS